MKFCVFSSLKNTNMTIT